MPGPHPGRRGYRDVLDVALGLAGLRDAEVAPLDACAGRALAEEVVASISVPAYARSAVDGFAVHSLDLKLAATDRPIRTIVEGSVRPGDPIPPALRVGAAMRVATGAPIPTGADTVVMIEDVVCEAGHATFSSPPAPGKHVIRVGEDIAANEKLLAKGRRLRPQDLGAVASLEIDALLVVRRPRVRVIVTGDEIVAPGAARSGTNIIDSNSVVVRSLADRDGATLRPTLYVGDDPQAITEALLDADADVVLVSGGSSVGEEDHAPRVLARIGSLDVRGARVRPGGPVSLGTVGDRLVFLLPGHPLACLAAYEMFAGPAIRAMGGGSAAWPHPTVRCALTSEVRSERGRTDYLRVLVEGDSARPLAHHAGASNLTSAVRADGAVLVPEEAETLAAGELVTVHLY